MRIKLQEVCIVLLSLVFLAGAEVCYRKYISKKRACRGRMRHSFSTGEKCCQKGKAMGYASKPVNLKGRKRLYVCSPCSGFIPKDNHVQPIEAAIISDSDGWTEWNDWNPCSQTCEAGVQKRTRRCLTGKCEGAEFELRPCSLRAYCPVDGRWGPWYPWGECSETCGGGVQKRHRDCNDPPPQNGGIPCSGPREETRACQDNPCPIDGGWSSWGPFSECSATCGKATKMTTRNCDSPAPQYGGRPCQGPSEDRSPCSLTKCPVNGGWSEWGNWTRCSVTCGVGHKIRRRSCDNPRPRFHGASCDGESMETTECVVPVKCPIHGQWSDWSDWGVCNADPCTGEKGFRIRSRSCNNPVPQFGGKYCRGPYVSKQMCYSNNTEACTEVDGGWCDWQNWTPCMQHSGSNLFYQQTRARECKCPSPAGTGRDCDGQELETRSCNPTPNTETAVDPSPIIIDSSVTPQKTADATTVQVAPASSTVTATPRSRKKQGQGCLEGSGSGMESDGSDINCDQESDSEDQHTETEGSAQSETVLEKITEKPPILIF